MLMRGTSLNTFLAVATEGSVHGAARRLNISQPALTRQIQALEREMGAPLFERSVNGMVLTQLGQLFLIHARETAEIWSEALDQIDDVRTGHAGTMVVGSGPAWIYNVIPHALSKIYREFPKLRVEIISRIDQYYALLDEGAIDILLAEIPKDQRQTPGLQYEPIVSVNRHIFAREEHPLTLKRNISARELLNFPWIQFKDSLLGASVIERYFRSFGLEPPPFSVATTSVQSGFALLAQHDYLMLLPGTIMDETAALGIYPLDIKGQLDNYTAGFIYRPSVMRMSHFASFRKHALEQTKILSGIERPKQPT